MKKTICCALFLFSLPTMAKADCSWVNALDYTCRAKFEASLKELKQNFPKVKSTSPFYKIYKLTTNNDNNLCQNFLQMAEDLRHFHIEDYRDAPIPPSILDIIGKRLELYDLKHFETENLRFTKLAPNSYLASHQINTSMYSYYHTHKMTNEVKEIPTDDFVTFPLNYDIPEYYYSDMSYDFYHNSNSGKFYTFFYDEYDRWDIYNFNGFIYELSTNNNQIKPLCEYDIKTPIPDDTAKFSELLRLYKIISGSECCRLASNRIYEIDDNILNRSYLLLLHPDKYRSRWMQHTNNVWQFYEDWASLSPVNRMQYQKFLIELEKYGNYFEKILKDNLEIANQNQSDTLKYLIVKTILNDIPIIYNYDAYRKTPSEFIQKIQNNTVSDEELRANLSQQYKIEQLYGDGWFVEPALFHALPLPQLLQRMLNLGYDVDVLNWYSKTPLMTAAHLNNYEAVQILLNANADMNKKMGNLIRDDLFPSYSEEYETYTAGRKNRTALMYACENADFKLIKLLIDNGADITAKDSQNNGLDYYLNLNNKLTAKEKNKLLKLIKK